MWKASQSTTDASKLTAELQVTDEALDFAKDEIEYHLAQHFARELVEQGLINLKEDRDPYRCITTFKAELKVLSPQAIKVVRSEFHYEVQGLRFSHEMIEEAMLNTWPERFL